MVSEITMPKLSDTMEEGKILRWLKRPGDDIHHGEAIAEVETDKADMILEAFEDGVLETIKLNEGETAPVGAVIALLKPAATSSAKAAASEGRSTPAIEVLGGEPPAGKGKGRARARRRPAPPPTPSPAPRFVEEAHPTSYPAMSAHQSADPTAVLKPPPRAAAAAVEPRPGNLEGTKVRASPLARRAAEEAQIDLSAVHGSGPEGRVTKRDVDNFLREQQLFRFRRIVSPHEGALGSREDLSRMRKTIARRMAASKREVPHFYVTVEVDMEEAVRLKHSLQTTELFEEDITYNDIIVKATALALERYPRINASYEDEGIVIYPSINIGVVVAVEDGLIVPVLKGCERLALPEVARLAHRLVGKAGRGGFTSEEMSGATFTISNMGMLGIEHFAAVINPPQAAVLAVSAIKDRPVVKDGRLAVGKTMMVTLSCDHRIIDGVVAGRFLQELKRFLENPATLLV